MDSQIERSLFEQFGTGIAILEDGWSEIIKFLVFGAIVAVSEHDVSSCSISEFYEGAAIPTPTISRLQNSNSTSHLAKPSFMNDV